MMEHEDQTPGASRVEALISRVMAEHPSKTQAAQHDYFEAVHQQLAPLARELELENEVLRAELVAAKAAGEYHANQTCEVTKAYQSELDALKGKEPLFWVRLCRDGTYEGPIHNAHIEPVRKRSGAWIPLVMIDSAIPPAPEDALPDRDQSKPAEQQGLFRKFVVSRTDGSDAPGGKHHGCRYFVLDVDHDQHASAALSAYATACEATHPALAKDLREKWGAPLPVAQPTPSVPDEAREWVMAAIAQALGNAYDCTRVWEAWSYGTMDEDDFSLIAEDSDRLREIADAAIMAMGASAPKPDAA